MERDSQRHERLEGCKRMCDRKLRAKFQGIGDWKEPQGAGW